MMVTSHVAAIYPCAVLKLRDSFNRAQWLGTESCDWDRFVFPYFSFREPSIKTYIQV